MIGLLRKDLFVAEKSGRLLLILALVFSMAPSLGAFGNTYAMMLAFMLPLNSIAYDERCKWDRYAAMLPYQAGQIVWSKYLLSYIYTALAEGIILLGARIRDVIQPGSGDWTDTWQLAALLAVIMVLLTALGLPLLYRFGSEKGRLVMFMVLGAGVGITFALTRELLVTKDLTLPPLPVLAAAAAAVVVLLTYVSFHVSVSFYRKRRDGVYL